MSKRAFFIAIAVVTAIMVVAPVAGQVGSAGSITVDSGETVAAEKPSTQPAIMIQHIRPQDKRGMNVFESPKNDATPYAGFRLDLGAGFTQQFQGLKHENSAAPMVVEGVNRNELIDIGSGFNTASANLYLNAQVAPGIRVAMTTYLSSRHHNETWVKDGYMLVDASPIESELLDNIFEYVTVKAGHFEINYGDAHFRRSDNGNAVFNTFVGNYIMDAFTTEVVGEVYFSNNGLMAMAAVTGGEIKGNLNTPDDRAPAFIGKLVIDRNFNESTRVRLTGSVYSNSKSPANTLYGGDRAGSRYYYVLENTTSTLNGNATSGLINPGFRYKVTAFQLNPFVKVGGAEFFGVLEKARGRAKLETEEREFTQVAGDLVYRFLRDERAYLGARYNRIEGQLQGMTNDVTVNRTALAGGWFITPSILMKGEYVNQRYNDFPLADIRNGGNFKGFVMEGVVAF